MGERSVQGLSEPQPTGAANRPQAPPSSQRDRVVDPGTDELIVHSPDEAAGKDYIGNAARDGRIATVFARLKVGSEDHGVRSIWLRDASRNA